jgi:hypothetical protein
MTMRPQLYAHNAAACRSAATHADATIRDRWLRLADQWAKMAEDAKRPCPLLKRFKPLSHRRRKTLSV